MAKGDGEYIILVNGRVETYTNWEDITSSIENNIKFNTTSKKKQKKK